MFEAFMYFHSCETSIYVQKRKWMKLYVNEKRKVYTCTLFGRVWGNECTCISSQEFKQPVYV